MTQRVLLIAGNGFIGAPTAVHLAHAGCEVTVYHGGSGPLPASARITGVTAARTPPPIVEFPSSLLASDFDVAVHFLCYGAPDAEAFLRAFDGAARRLILISSGDVYRAYGRFIQLEPGAPEPTPLTENAPLRTQLYPYRAAAKDDLQHWYEKIEAERVVRASQGSEIVVLRLAKVYGANRNANLATVYGFAQRPDWRWTHVCVENAAAAIAAAALHAAAGGETFNIGEAETPTIEERLNWLPKRASTPAPGAYDFNQHMHMDTTKIRTLLGYKDVVDEREAMMRVATQAA